MSDAKFHEFQGYQIPVDLMLLTGGGPDTFDAISRAHIANLERHVGLSPSHQVLEIGCSIGRDAIPLTRILSAERGGGYVGIDVIKRSIDWCKASIEPRNPHFCFLHMDIRDKLHNPSGVVDATSARLEVADRSVDRIILQSVFTHMLRPEFEHYLREFRRVMKPDGLIYATVFIYDDAILASARKTNLTPYDLRFEHEAEPGCVINNLDYPTGAVAYTREVIDSMVARAGLRHAKEPLKGAWSGFHPVADDGQDVLILKRAA